MAKPDRIREDVGLTVRVQEDGDFKTLDAELRMAIAGDASGVTLDLGAVSFIDSSGLRAVLMMANQSIRNGGRLRLLRGSAPLERAITKGGMGHLLPSPS